MFIRENYKENVDIYERTSSGEADKLAMARLAGISLYSNLHVVDLPYRLSSWALDDPTNTRLWVDAQGRLLAWAVMQTPFWALDYVLHPEVEADLHPQILAWADRHAWQALDTPSGHPSWYVCAFADQAQRLRDLEAAGFESQADVGEDSWTKVLMHRPAQVPLRQYRLPAGFTVRTLEGEREVDAYVALHQAVFETKNMTVDWRRRTLQHPDYRPDLDVVIAAPDGRLAAFCIGWAVEVPGEGLAGHIEPLGCHQDFRRYALGRLALVEVLRRMQAIRAQSIYVETDNYRGTALALYESVGFRIARNVLVYRRDYPTG